jgi:hypothetical protein
MKPTTICYSITRGETGRIPIKLAKASRKTIKSESI